MTCLCLCSIMSPDYASIPELGLDLKTTRGSNEVILEMTDDFQINTDTNPAYGSPELPTKNGRSQLGLDLKSIKRGSNEVILEMTDDFQINTDTNPAYESPELSTKNGHSQSNGHTNGGSRLKRVLSNGLRQNSAVEQSRDEKNKRRTERESDLYI